MPESKLKVPQYFEAVDELQTCQIVVHTMHIKDGGRATRRGIVGLVADPTKTYHFRILGSLSHAAPQESP